MLKAALVPLGHAPVDRKSLADKAVPMPDLTPSSPRPRWRTDALQSRPLVNALPSSSAGPVVHAPAIADEVVEPEMPEDNDEPGIAPGKSV